MKDKPPKLPSFRHPDGIHQVVWCADCLRYHFHGAGPGHRVSHCHDTPVRRSYESRYHDTGYTLVDCGAMSAEMLADTERKRPRGPADQSR